MSNLKDYLGGLDPATWTDAKADHLDADVSSRAPASTALVNTTWSDAKANHLDADVSSRAPSSTALVNTTWSDARATKLDTVLTNVTWTDARAAQLDLIAPTDVSNLDVAVSTRAPASTALSTTDWTTARAGKLDNVDATVSSRAPSSTALSTSTWTSARAAKLDLISSAASLSSCTVQHLSTTSNITSDNSSGTNWTISSIDRNKSFISINTHYDPNSSEHIISAKFSSNTNIKYWQVQRWKSPTTFLWQYESMVYKDGQNNIALQLQCTTIS